MYLMKTAVEPQRRRRRSWIPSSNDRFPLVFPWCNALSGIFQNESAMAEQTNWEVVTGSVETTNTFTNDHNLRSKMCLPTSQGKGINIHIKSDTKCYIASRTNDFSDEQSATETSGRLSQETPTTTSKNTPNSSKSDEINSKDIVVTTENKENYIISCVSDVGLSLFYSYSLVHDVHVLLFVGSCSTCSYDIFLCP